jgi:hypothetical protein
VEFIIGFAVALAAIFVIKRFLFNDKLLNEIKRPKFAYRQSHIFSLISPALPYLNIQSNKSPTQSMLNNQKNQQRMIFTEDKAYWIKDNAFYEAKVVDGEIDKENAKVVDTMAMDKVELDKMIFIVEKLTEGIKNDFGNPGV